MAISNQHRNPVLARMAHCEFDDGDVRLAGVGATELRQRSNAPVALRHFNEEVVRVANWIRLTIPLVKLETCLETFMYSSTLVLICEMDLFCLP